MFYTFFTSCAFALTIYVLCSFLSCRFFLPDAEDVCIPFVTYFSVGHNRQRFGTRWWRGGWGWHCCPRFCSILVSGHPFQIDIPFQVLFYFSVLILLVFVFFLYKHKLLEMLEKVYEETINPFVEPRCFFCDTDDMSQKKDAPQQLWPIRRKLANALASTHSNGNGFASKLF